MALRSQTAIFSQHVRDFMGPRPLAVPTGTACGEVVRRMAAAETSSAMVTDEAGRAVGIVTEQDVVRRMAFAVAPETPVDEIMTRPVETIPENEYLYHAIAWMRRRGLRHMPIVDREGRPAGMLHLNDTLATASTRIMDHIDRLTRDETLDGFRDMKAAQVELAGQLFEDNVPAPEIQAVLTHINNDIYRRVLAAALRDMGKEGWGEPPVPFAAIVMGSSGRGENYLRPDQDHGFVLGDYPDRQHSRIDAYFIELAERMTRDLDAVGFPLCRGYVMPTNPMWRKNLRQWREQINLWIRRRGVVAIRLSDIFFDFRPVYGSEDLAEALRHHVTRTVRKAHPFLQEMYHDEADHNVALGIFSRFITEKRDEGHRGEINLKHTGTLPLVEAVRLLALREGVDVTSTVARIHSLEARGVLNANDREYLISAYNHIALLLLRTQIADHKAGRSISSYVSPARLSKREKDLLVDALKSIDALRKRVRMDFTGDVF